jgi:hypothetical protein
VDCSRIFDKTILNSPDPEVLSSLAEQEILLVTAEAPEGPLLAVTSDERIAGSITSQYMLDILRCIAEGRDFVAVVLSVSGGACHVEVRPESK